MKKALCLFFTLCTFTVYAHTLQELSDDPVSFDDTMVTFEAEVIGEPLKGNGGIWLNLSSNGFNIGVFLPDSEKVRAIQHFGAYNTQGDIVRVSGRFHKDCPMHHERDVHVQRLEVVRRGYVKSETIPKSKVIVSLILAIICLTLVGCYFLKIKYGTRAGKNKTKG